MEDDEYKIARCYREMFGHPEVSLHQYVYYTVEHEQCSALRLIHLYRISNEQYLMTLDARDFGRFFEEIDELQWKKYVNKTLNKK